MDFELNLSDGRRIPIPRTGLVIGRGPGVDVSFPGVLGIEPMHVRLQRIGSQWFLEAVSGASFQIGGKDFKTSRMSPGTQVDLNGKGFGFTFEVQAAQSAALRHGTATESNSVESATDIQASQSPATQPFPKRLLVGIGVGILCLFLGIAGWQLFSPPAPPDPLTTITEPSPAPAHEPGPPPKGSSVTDPRDFLVLFGYRNPAEDLPPNVITVGWLADASTVVVPAEILRGFEMALQDAKQQGTPLQLCILVGSPVDVTSWSYPPSCPQVALLTTAEPVAKVGDIQSYFCEHASRQLGRLAERGGSIWHCSYERLPRSVTLNQPLVSLVSYTPGMARQLLQETQVSLELSPQGDSGRIADPVKADAPKLEWGGLLLDSENKILAMCLPTGELVWSDDLHKMANSLR